MSKRRAGAKAAAPEPPKLLEDEDAPLDLPPDSDEEQEAAGSASSGEAGDLADFEDESGDEAGDEEADAGSSASEEVSGDEEEEGESDDEDGDSDEADERDSLEDGSDEGDEAGGSTVAYTSGSDAARARRGKPERSAGAASSSAEPAAAGEESDSSGDEGPKNRVGKIPMKWYEEMPHIGYDVEGKKIMKKGKKKNALDKLIDPNAWRTIYDEVNDEEIVLSKKEIETIMRLRRNEYPDADFDPYLPMLDTPYEDGIHPLSSVPEPKRRFIPSKWEAKKIVKMVRAIRNGWVKEAQEREAARKKPESYMLWDDSEQARFSPFLYPPFPPLRPLLPPGRCHSSMALCAQSLPACPAPSSLLSSLPSLRPGIF
eukprot:tig00000382_g24572.t1